MTHIFENSLSKNCVGQKCFIRANNLPHFMNKPLENVPKMFENVLRKQFVTIHE